MAITILQSPDYGHGVHQPMWHYVTSSNVGNTDFRYIFDVYVGSDLVHRAKVIPDADNGLFDASRIVRDYLVDYYKPKPNTPPLAMNTADFAVPYTVQYGEEYTTGGITTTYTNLMSGTYTGFNAYSLFLPNGDPNLPLDGKDFAFLTDRDLNEVWMPRNGALYLPYYNPEEEDNSITVQALDGDYNPTGSSKTAYISLTNTLMQIYNLNPEYTGGFVDDYVGGTPLALETKPGYRFRVSRYAGVSETPYVSVKFFCEPRIQAVPVHFLNRYGAFETFYFRGVWRDEVAVSRQTLRRQGTVRVGNAIQEYNNDSVYANTVMPYATNLQATRKLRSGFVSDKDHNWLMQLIASPQVYIQSPEGFHFPVVIKTDKWSQKRAGFDSLYELELEIQLTRNVQAQYR